MEEAEYKRIISAYLTHQSTVDEFIAAFMHQWRCDRDRAGEQTEGRLDLSAARFGRLMDRLFTSCDCYAQHPEEEFDISEKELRKEVALFASIWWG